MMKDTNKLHDSCSPNKLTDRWKHAYA